MKHRNVALLVFVGGYLGAGKTTLLLEAARRLIGRGKRVAVITNDQDRELVDTKFIAMSGLNVREVVGGCFCCRLSDLLETAEELLDRYDPEIILAEPVGSCIDLSSTLLQPIKAYYGGDYCLAPLTVLVDPMLAAQVASGEADEDTTYLFNNQIAEADLIAVTKVDLLDGGSLQLDYPIEMELSGKTGQGVDEWLETILSGARVAGSRPLDVDYDRYANAEAALGWVNVQGTAQLRQAASPASISGPLLEAIEQALTTEKIRIAHLKIFDRNPFGFVKVSISGHRDEANPQGDLLTEPSEEHEIAINLRALGAPERLEQIVIEALRTIPGTVKVSHSAAFRPARPVPERRMVSPVR